MAERRIAVVLLAAASCTRWGFDHVADEAVSGGATQLDMPGGVALSLSGDDSLAFAHTVIGEPAGNGFVAAWAEYASGSLQETIGFALLDRDGNVALKKERIYTLSSDYASSSMLDVSRFRLTPTHFGYLLSFHDSNIMTGMALDRQGDVLHKYRLSTYASAQLVALPNGVAVIYTRDIGTEQIFFRHLDDYGLPLADRVQIDPTSDGQYYPSSAWTGDSLLCVWTDYRNGQRIQIANLDTSGALLAPSRTLLDRGDAQGSSNLAWDGQQGLVFWGEDDAQHAMLVDESGTPQWPDAVELIPPNRRESHDDDLAGAGGSFVYVWENDVDSVLTQIAMQTVTAATSAPSNVTITDPAFHYWYPAVTAIPDRFAISFFGRVAGARRAMVMVVAP